MLQQTQVKTVIPYFQKFTNEIKTFKKLSTTSERKSLNFGKDWVIIDKKIL